MTRHRFGSLRIAHDPKTTKAVRTPRTPKAAAGRIGGCFANFFSHLPAGLVFYASPAYTAWVFQQVFSSTQAPLPVSSIQRQQQHQRSALRTRYELAEVELQRRIKQAGGKWNPARRLWELRYDQALKLGLKGRIENPQVSDNINLWVSDNSTKFLIAQISWCYQKPFRAA